MNNKRSFAAVAAGASAAVMLIVALGACSGGRGEPNAPPAGSANRSAPATAPAGPAIDIGDAAPDFTLPGPDDKPVSLADFKGKIVVLEETNPECPFTGRHFAAGTQANLARKYADKGVVWLGIDSTSTHTPLQQRAFAKLFGLPYAILSDPAGRAGRLYGMRTTPDVRIIDAAGRVAYIGALDDDPMGTKKDQAVNYVAAALEDLLAGRKVQTPRTRNYGCEVFHAPPKPEAPDFTLSDQDGKNVRLADYAGKIVVLEWINPQCPYSRGHAERGTMKRLAEAYAPKDVVWLEINSTHTYDVAKNKAWHDEHKLPFPILDDHAGKVGRAYEAKTTPDMRIIARDGSVAYRGAIDDDPQARAEKPTNYVAQALEELLAGKKVSTPLTQSYGCTVKYAP